jgi:hypothetical protein
MSPDSLHKMEYPVDSTRFMQQPPEWTQLDEASIDAGKYIIFDYILSESQKVTHQKEIEIENLFENFIVWTLEDYEKFCELIEALPNTTENETSFRESLLGYLEDYSGFGKEPDDI